MIKVQSSKLNVNSFVIGVDGGGTKTAAALADMDGKTIARAAAGRSNMRHTGIKLAAENVAKAIYDLIKRRKTSKSPLFLSVCRRWKRNIRVKSRR